MDERVVDPMHPSAPPFLFGKGCEVSVVLVVAIYEQRGPGAFLAPSLPFGIRLVASEPYETRIAADDDVIVLAEPLAFGEGIGLQLAYVEGAVRVSRNVYQLRVSSSPWQRRYPPYRLMALTVEVGEPSW